MVGFTNVVDPDSALICNKFSDQTTKQILGQYDLVDLPGITLSSSKYQFQLQSEWNSFKSHFRSQIADGGWCVLVRVWTKIRTRLKMAEHETKNEVITKLLIFATKSVKPNQHDHDNACQIPCLSKIQRDLAETRQCPPNVTLRRIDFGLADRPKRVLTCPCCLFRQLARCKTPL